MVKLEVGAVVFVRFPFSDLSQAKVRPALVLANAGRGDWIFCQITSNPYGDVWAMVLTDKNFKSGSLRVTSYARPGKLFTGNERLVVDLAGILKREIVARIQRAVTNLICGQA